MSTSVDNRVVKMTFDNASFERGVEKTMRSLKTLDETLAFKGSDKGLSTLSKAISSLPLDGLVSGLDTLKTKASSVFGGITNAATNMAKVVALTSAGLMTAATTAAVVGGTRRAANIEQARFQIQGLHMDWDTLSKDMDYAVSGTAFGLDEAARAAAQFGASGVAAGEDMRKALRGISGVAAMTNSSYSDIANIFTRVAGQGRVMAIDLNSIAARGMNAAAKLGERLGVTESEIRDMVSKGQIDFKTFADAMDWAFGEQAMKANETFTGAFSNMKAALSRIGADFMTPVRELGRETFLGLRAVFDNVRKGLNAVGEIPKHAGMAVAAPLEEEWSIVSSFVRNFDTFGDTMQESLTKIANSNVISTFVSSFLGPADALLYTTKINLQAIAGILTDKIVGLDFSGLKGQLDAITPIITGFGEWTAASIPKVIDILSNMFGVLFDIASVVGSYVSPVLGVLFEAIFGGMENAGATVNEFLGNANGFLEWLRGIIQPLKLDEEGTRKLSDATRMLFGILGNLGTTVSNVLGPAFSIASDILAKVLPIVGSIGEAAGSVLAPALEVASYALSVISAKLAEAVPKIKEFVGSFIDFDGIKGFFDGLATSAKDAFSSIDTSQIKGFLDSLFGGTVDAKAIGDQIASGIGGAFDVLAGFFERLKARIEEAGSVVKGAMETVKEFAGEVKAFVNEALNPVSEKMGEVSESADGMASSLKNSIGGVFKPITDFFSFLTSNVGLNEVVTAVSGLFTGLTAGFTVKFLKGLSDIPKTLNKIGTMISDYTEIIPNIGESFVGVLDSLTGVLEGFQKKLQAEAIKEIAISIAILAGSIIALSLVDPERIGQAVAGLLLVLLAVGGLIAEMTQLTKDLELKQMVSMTLAFKSLGMAIAAIGAGVLLMAAAVNIFASMKPDELIKGMGVLGATLLAMAIFGKIISGIEGQLVDLGRSIALIGLAMIPFALAMKLLSSTVTNNPVGTFAALGVIAAFIGGLGVLLHKTDIAGEKKKLVQLGVSISLISTSMLVLAAAITLMGLIPWNVALQGVGAFVSIMVTVAIMSAIVKETGDDLLKAAGSIAILSVSLIAFAGAIALMGVASNSITSLLVVTLGLMAMASVLETLSKNQNIMTAAAAIGVMSLSLMNFALTIAVLSTIPWQALVASLVSIAVVFITLGAAGYVLGPMVDVIFGLAAAVALLGVGLIAIAASLPIFAMGLMMLASIGPAAAEAIGVALENLASHLGNIFSSIGSAIVDGITSLAQRLSENAPQLQTSGVTIGRSVLEGLGQLIPEMAVKGFELLMSFLKAIGDHIGSVAQKGADIVVGLIAGIASRIGAIIDAAVKLGIMFIVGLADAIRNNIELVAKAVEVLGSTIGSVFLDGMAELVSHIPVVGEDMANELRNTSSSLKAGADEASSFINEAFNNQYGELLNKTDSVMDDVKGTISGSAGGMSSAGGEAGAAGALGFVSSFEAMPKDVSSDFTTAISGVSGLSGTASAAGGKVGSGLANGANTPLNSLPDKFRSKTQSAVNAAGNVSSSGQGNAVGSNFGSGMYWGMDGWVGSIASKAAEMVRAAKNAANAEQNSASPAKDLIEIGGWFGEGYAIGIEKTFGMVTSKASDMVSAAKSAVEDSVFRMSSLADSIDWDSTPTITPVLDLSNISSGMATMDGMFAAHEQYRVGAYVGRSYATAPANGAGGYSSNTYNITLDWNAGVDANEVVIALGNAIRQRRNMEA